jgi:hypothetical protein
MLRIAIDVRNKYIPYFQNLAGTQCGTNGGCCTDMYKNVKMWGKQGGEDCGLVADALRTLVDGCSAVVGNQQLSGGSMVSEKLDCSSTVNFDTEIGSRLLCNCLLNIPRANTLINH